MTQIRTVTRIQIVTQIRTATRMQLQTAIRTQIVTQVQTTRIPIDSDSKTRIVIQTRYKFSKGSHTENLVTLKEIQIDLLKSHTNQPQRPKYNQTNQNNIDHNINHTRINGDGAPYKRRQNIINSSSGHRNQK